MKRRSGCEVCVSFGWDVKTLRDVSAVGSEVVSNVVGRHVGCEPSCTLRRCGSISHTIESSTQWCWLCSLQELHQVPSDYQAFDGL